MLRKWLISGNSPGNENKYKKLKNTVLANVEKGAEPRMFRRSKNSSVTPGHKKKQ